MENLLAELRAIRASRITAEQQGAVDLCIEAATKRTPVVTDEAVDAAAYCIRIGAGLPAEFVARGALEAALPLLNGDAS